MTLKEKQRVIHNVTRGLIVSYRTVTLSLLAAIGFFSKEVYVMVKEDYDKTKNRISVVENDVRDIKYRLGMFSFSSDHKERSTE